MIQRIQSLFILCTVVLMSFLIFSPISKIITSNDQTLSYFSYGIFDLGTEKTLVYQTFPLLILISVIVIIGVITIFLYTNRPMQIRLCVYNILLLFGLIGLLIFYHFNIRNQLEVISNSYSFTAIFPIVAIILVFQAFRAIRRDDLLIKSYDRLR